MSGPVLPREARERLIVALDVPGPREAVELARRLGDSVLWVKVGLELFCSAGPAVVEELARSGKRIFLDLKFHDIPNTIAGAVRAAARLPVGLVDLHASAGSRAMEEAARAQGESVDYLTFVPDGEPTLDIGLGRVIERLKPLGVRVAVISNGSLLWRTDVRAALAQVDWVSVKVDAIRPDVWRRINRPLNRMAYALGDWMSGERIKEGVIEALPHLWPRPLLLISAGRRNELHFNRLFFEAAREPKDLWENLRATHASVFLYEPQEYRQRLRDFFRAALLAA